MSDLGITAPIVTMIAGPAYKEFIDATGPLAESVSSAAWWRPAVRYDGKGVLARRKILTRYGNRNIRTRRTMRRLPLLRPEKSSSSRSRRRTVLT